MGQTLNSLEIERPHKIQLAQRNRLKKVNIKKTNFKKAKLKKARLQQKITRPNPGRTNACSQYLRRAITSPFQVIHHIVWCFKR